MTQDISMLYALLVRWIQLTHEEYIRKNPTAVFLNINIEGQGFIGDDAGAVYFEFDTIRDGIEQLQRRGDAHG